VTDLPDGWTWATLGEIAEVVGGVPKDGKRESHPDLVQVPYLRVANVQRGRIDLAYVASIRVTAEKAARLRFTAL
jgi:type I restriction enzyme S subunit